MALVDDFQSRMSAINTMLQKILESQERMEKNLLSSSRPTPCLQSAEVPPYKGGEPISLSLEAKQIDAISPAFSNCSTLVDVQSSEPKLLDLQSNELIDSFCFVESELREKGNVSPHQMFDAVPLHSSSANLQMDGMSNGIQQVDKGSSADFSIHYVKELALSMIESISDTVDISISGSSIFHFHDFTLCKFNSIMPPCCFDPGILLCSYTIMCPCHSCAIIVVYDEFIKESMISGRIVIDEHASDSIKCFFTENEPNSVCKSKYGDEQQVITHWDEYYTSSSVILVCGIPYRVMPNGSVPSNGSCLASSKENYASVIPLNHTPRYKWILKYESMPGIVVSYIQVTWISEQALGPKKIRNDCYFSHSFEDCEWPAMTCQNFYKHSLCYGHVYVLNAESTLSKGMTNGKYTHLDRYNKFNSLARLVGCVSFKGAGFGNSNASNVSRFGLHLVGIEIMCISLSKSHVSSRKVHRYSRQSSSDLVLFVCNGAWWISQHQTIYKSVNDSYYSQIKDVLLAAISSVLKLQCILFGVSTMVQYLKIPLHTSGIQFHILQFLVKIHGLLSIFVGTSYTKRCVSVMSGSFSMYLAQYDCVVISFPDQFWQAKSHLYDARDSCFLISSMRPYTLISLLVRANFRFGWFVFKIPAEPNNNDVYGHSDLLGFTIIAVEQLIARVAKLDIDSELLSFEQIAVWTWIMAWTLQIRYWLYYSVIYSDRKVICCLFHLATLLQQDFIQVIKYIRTIEAEVVHQTYFWDSNQHNPVTIQQQFSRFFDVLQMPSRKTFQSLKQELMHVYISKVLYKAVQAGTQVVMVCSHGGSAFWAKILISGLIWELIFISPWVALLLISAYTVGSWFPYYASLKDDLKDFPDACSTLTSTSHYDGSLCLSPKETLFEYTFATLCAHINWYYFRSIAWVIQVSNSGIQWGKLGSRVLSIRKYANDGFNLVENKVFTVQSQSVSQWTHILKECLLVSQCLAIAYIHVLLQPYHSRLKISRFLIQNEPATFVQLCIFGADSVLVCMILRTFLTCVLLPVAILWHIASFSTTFDNSLWIRYLSGKKVWAVLDSFYNLKVHLPVTQIQEGGYHLTTPATPICKVSSTDYERTFQVGDHVNIRLAFHVSQLQQKVCLFDKVFSMLPRLTAIGEFPLQPMAICAQRLSHHHHRAVGSEVLVQWTTTTNSNTTWEDVQHIQSRFPSL